MKWCCFIFICLVFPACGARKGAEGSAVRLRVLSDSSFVRQTAARQVFDYAIVRDVRLNPPDSAGRQFVASLTETRLFREEQDSVCSVQAETAKLEGVEASSFRQLPCNRGLSHWVLLVVVVVSVVVILFKR